MIRLAQILMVVMLLSGFCVACGGGSDDGVTVGVVILSSSMDATVEGFKSEMTKRGYVEGDNINYIFNGPTGTIDAMAGQIETVLAADVDLLLAVSTPAATAAKAALEGSNTPLVFTVVTDAVANGIVDSLISPGGNITGIQIGGNIEKEFDWLLALDPGISKIYIPHNPEDAGGASSLAETQKAADKLGIELIISEVRTHDEATAALAAIPEDAQALFLTGSGFLNQHLDEYIEAAVSNAIPVASVGSFYEDGMMLTYGHDFTQDGVQAGRLAAKILDGADPANLSVETAEFFLGLNLKTAGAIGIEIPKSVLDQADFIVR